MQRLNRQRNGLSHSEAGGKYMENLLSCMRAESLCETALICILKQQSVMNNAMQWQAVVLFLKIFICPEYVL